ncbi:MAG: hypothetical protein AB7E42_09955 [Anaerotignaceae bacterium]
MQLWEAVNAGQGTRLRLSLLPDGLKRVRYALLFKSRWKSKGKPFAKHAEKQPLALEDSAWFLVMGGHE